MSSRRSTVIKYQTVASIYTKACEKGENPSLAVARELNVSRNAARKTVQRARASGYLNPVTPGLRANRCRKLVLLSERLGVDYRTLLEAITECCDGDIRIGD